MDLNFFITLFFSIATAVFTFLGARFCLDFYIKNQLTVHKTSYNLGMALLFLSIAYGIKIFGLFVTDIELLKEIHFFLNIGIIFSLFHATRLSTYLHFYNLKNKKKK